MDKNGFEIFLKKGGRSKSAIDRCVRYVLEFEHYLLEERAGNNLNQVNSMDLEDFVSWIEAKEKRSAKSHLWAIRYYYEYVSNEEMSRLAGLLREQRIKRVPFLIKDFRGANQEYVSKLNALGIKNIDQMLEAGRNQKKRKKLSERTGIPPQAILEFVKLSDLARIPGVKGIRARLYYDVGIDTVEKMATWDPEELNALMVKYVEKTGFEGVATLPAEAKFTIAQAKALPKIIEYE